MRGGSSSPSPSLVFLMKCIGFERTACIFGRVLSGFLPRVLIQAVSPGKKARGSASFDLVQKEG